MMCRDKPKSDDDPGDVVHDGQGGQGGCGKVSGLSGGGGARDDGAQSKGAVQCEHPVDDVGGGAGDDGQEDSVEGDHGDNPTGHGRVPNRRGGIDMVG